MLANGGKNQPTLRETTKGQASQGRVSEKARPLKYREVWGHKSGIASTWADVHAERSLALMKHVARL